MGAAQVIGIIGGYGAVGSVAARCLAADGFRLRIGGRSADRGAAAAAGFADATAAAVDATDAESIARFSADCDVVLNCAGPAYELGTLPRKAVVGAGAHYVDVMDGSLGTFAPPEDRVMVLSAGVLPGLSGLLPQMLTAGLDEACFVGYYGSLDRFTHTGAMDYLLSMDRGYGTALAKWRDGRVIPGALSVEQDSPVPGILRPVTAYPYLSAELVQQATRLGLKEASWYNAFDGEHALRVLNHYRASGNRQSPEDAATALVQASALDVSGRAPYHVLSGTAEGLTEERVPVRRTALIKSNDGNALTGVVGAVAAREVARGRIAPGVCHEAANVLAAGVVLDAIRTHLPETVVSISETPLAAEIVEEEGVL
ncbi:saccharopine dehydrogenase NADP-binding domain-containing protein [Microbispora sp. CA-135349]|uniref:saccharopine dehydrogenase NADP-binding domain-containing protein n=1 Tax=Microbispora sp. CA-135349 TaxID=3239953 RepID=UPI003D925918